MTEHRFVAQTPNGLEALAVEQEKIDVVDEFVPPACTNRVPESARIGVPERLTGLLGNPCGTSVDLQLGKGGPLELQGERVHVSPPRRATSWVARKPFYSVMCTSESALVKRSP